MKRRQQSPFIPTKHPSIDFCTQSISHVSRVTHFLSIVPVFINAREILCAEWRLINLQLRPRWWGCGGGAVCCWAEGTGVMKVICGVANGPGLKWFFWLKVWSNETLCNDMCGKMKRFSHLFFVYGKIVCHRTNCLLSEYSDFVSYSHNFIKLNVAQLMYF